MSLRLKFLLLIIAPLFGIFAIILALGLHAFENNARRTVAHELLQSAELHAAKIEVLLREVAQIASTTAEHLSIDSDIDESRLHSRILRSNVAPTRWFSVPPSPMNRERLRAGSSSDRMSTGKARTWRYRQRPNSTMTIPCPSGTGGILPRDASTGVWTEPYFDEGGGNIYMTTFSAPFFREASLYRCGNHRYSAGTPETVDFFPAG